MTALHSQPYKDAIDRLIARRHELGWSQEELARRLPRYERPASAADEEPAPEGGVGQLQSFVSKFEQRQRRLDVIEFMHVCHVLGLRVSEVLGEHAWDGAAPPSVVPLAREPLIEERALGPRRVRPARPPGETPAARPLPPLGGASISREDEGSPLGDLAAELSEAKPPSDSKPARSRRRKPRRR